VGAAPDHLGRAIDIAVDSATSGGGPFGCVVVTADGRAFEGRNEVVALCDPSAHAEIQAVRAACAALGEPALPGATVYASAEPCPMCFAALHWAGVESVIFAATPAQAADAGFDDTAISGIATGETVDPIPFVHVPRANSDAPFAAWRSNPDRAEY